MKTTFVIPANRAPGGSRSIPGRPPLVPSLLALLVLCALSGQAAIPEPDNLFYGGITLDNEPVTAAQTDVVIEARRTADGPVLASYRMGSDPALGNFYLLRLPLESVAGTANPDATRVGDSVFITLLDDGGLRAQTGFVINERGSVQRIDFGVVETDVDGNGLPDVWELYHFDGLSQGAGALAANGQTLAEHYLANTDPNDPEAEGFQLHLTAAGNLKKVSFTARPAEGPGYEGLTRLYTLESKTGLADPLWSGVTGFIEVAGNHQTVVYQTAGNSGTAFFRGRITLRSTTVTDGDLDGDGLPDVWEQHHFGDLNQHAGSLNANGQTALQNYVAGTAPSVIDGGFKLNLNSAGVYPVVSFTTIPAQGIGYEGRQRLYALDASPSPTGPWQPVSGLTGVLAGGQSVTHEVTEQAGPVFFRGRVWLEP